MPHAQAHEHVRRARERHRLALRERRHGKQRVAQGGDGPAHPEHEHARERQAERHGERPRAAQPRPRVVRRPPGGERERGDEQERVHQVPGHPPRARDRRVARDQLEQHEAGADERFQHHEHARRHGAAAHQAPGRGSYGTFVRVLGRYVRDLKVITLEDAVRKMSAYPAQRIGLADRGVLREGLKADLAVFDPNTVRDLATFEQPHQYAEGVTLVVVNGQVVFENGKMTAARPGRVIYGPARKP